MKSQLVHLLPDAYEKPVRGREEETATNTWRVFLPAEGRADAFMEECGDVFALSDLDTIYGDALKELTQMYGVTVKSDWDDEKTRFALKARIAVILSDGAEASINALLQTLFELETGDVVLHDGTDSDGETCQVDLNIADSHALYRLPCSLEELMDVIEDLLPAGVALRHSEEHDITILSGGGFLYVGVGEERLEKFDGLGYDEPRYGTLG